MTKFVYLKKSCVLKEIPCSNTEMQRRLKLNKWPKPVYFGPKTRFWRSDKIDKFKELISQGKDWSSEAELEFEREITPSSESEGESQR